MSTPSALAPDDAKYLSSMPRKRWESRPQCWCCGELKGLDQFDGNSRRCRSCVAIYDKHPVAPPQKEICQRCQTEHPVQAFRRAENGERICDECERAQRSNDGWLKRGFDAESAAKIVAYRRDRQTVGEPPIKEWVQECALCGLTFNSFGQFEACELCEELLDTYDEDRLFAMYHRGTAHKNRRLEAALREATPRPAARRKIPTTPPPAENAASVGRSGKNRAGRGVGTIERGERRYHVKGKRVWERVRVWEQHYGAIPAGKTPYHINGDRLDCRIENLTLVDITVRQRLLRGILYIDNQEHKQCRKCRVVKPVASFPKGEGENGTGAWCRFCVAAYARDRRAQRGQAMRASTDRSQWEQAQAATEQPQADRQAA